MDADLGECCTDRGRERVVFALRLIDRTGVKRGAHRQDREEREERRRIGRVGSSAWGEAHRSSGYSSCLRSQIVRAWPNAGFPPWQDGLDVSHRDVKVASLKERMMPQLSPMTIRQFLIGARSPGRIRPSASRRSTWQIQATWSDT